MSSSPNLIDLEHLPHLKLADSVSNSSSTGQIFPHEKAYVLDNRHLVCNALCSYNRKRFNIVDLHFNRVSQSYKISFNPDEFPLNHIFIPSDPQNGFLCTHGVRSELTVYKAWLDSSTGYMAINQDFEPAKIDVTHGRKCEILKTDQVQLFLVWCYEYHDLSYLSVRHCSNLEFEVAQVRLPGPRNDENDDQDGRTFPLHPSKFYVTLFDGCLNFVKFEQTSLENDGFRLISSLYKVCLPKANQDKNVQMEKFEADGFPDIVEIHFQLSGVWRAHTFICCIQYMQDQRLQSQILMLDVLTRQWTQMMEQTRGALCVLENIEPTLGSLNFFSYKIIDNHGWEQAEVSKKLYRLPVAKPEKLEFLSRLVVLNSGLLNKRAETQNHLDQIEREKRKIAKLQESIETLKLKAIEARKEDPTQCLPVYLNLELSGTDVFGSD